MNDFSHSNNCIGIHKGAYCYTIGDVRIKIRQKLDETMPYDEMQSKLSYSEIENIVNGFENLIIDLISKHSPTKSHGELTHS